MYWLIAKTALLSFIGISVLHYLYLYFTSVLTVPKVKDHVYLPASQYKELYQSMERDYQPSDNQQTSSDMKNELKEYLQQLGTKNGIASRPSSRPSSPLSVVSLRSGNVTPWENTPADDSMPSLSEYDTLPSFGSAL